MRNTLLVMRYELITTLKRRSFLLMAFGIPLIGTLAVIIISSNRSGSIAGRPTSPQPQSYEAHIEGYVDHSGWIKEIPAPLTEDMLRAFPDEEQAQRALLAGEIAAYYIIPEDVIERGEMTYVIPDRGLSFADNQNWRMQRTFLYNLVGGDEALTDRVWNPMNLQVTNLSPQESIVGEDDCSSPGYACQSNAIVRMLPLFVVILFLVFLSTGSGLLIRGLSNEKQNRMIEILMASIQPSQLLAGKIMGLGIAGLMQSTVWLGTGYFILTTRAGTLNLPPDFELPASILTWGILYFLLGYAIYASLMAGAGALVPDTKAVSSATWLVMLPLFIGYFIAVTPLGLEAPHGALATVLSLFPLTAPVVMVMRLTVGGLPAWQPALGALLMAASAWLIVRAVARMFHAQNLLSGQPFSARRYLTALLRAS